MCHLPMVLCSSSAIPSCGSALADRETRWEVNCSVKNGQRRRASFFCFSPEDGRIMIYTYRQIKHIYCIHLFVHFFVPTYVSIFFTNFMYRVLELLGQNLKNSPGNPGSVSRFYSAYDLRNQRVGFAVARHVGVPEERAQA